MSPNPAETFASPAPTEPGARRVALVTGSARRIGREIALELARHGWDLALHSHHPDEQAHETLAEVRAIGARAELLSADLAHEPACRALLPSAAQRLGRVDAVVNNASVFEWDDVQAFGQSTLELHWKVNTAAPVLLAQALQRHLAGDLAPRRGVVVNLLDQKLWNPNPDHFSYTLSKAALESATTMLAMALAPAIRVCGVAPGVTLPSGPMDAAAFSRSHRMTPLGRSSTPADIASAVRFLLESPAITGTTLLVDGGQHLLGQRRDVMFLQADTA